MDRPKKLSIAGKMADLHRWIELSGLSTDSHLDERLKSLSLKRAKHAQTPYDIEEADFPGTQVGLWYKLYHQWQQTVLYCTDDELSDKL